MGVARVAIEAPHDVLILRGENYRSGTIPKEEEEETMRSRRYTG